MKLDGERRRKLARARLLEPEVAAHATRADDDSSRTGLNISALARRTGVAPDTLRKWEQRYGIIRPTRTPGGQRRYSEVDVARIEWLRDRLAEGYRIGEAATLLGSARSTTSTTREDYRERILAAAESSDSAQIGRLLDQSFALYGVKRTLVDVVAPLLVAIGRAWEEGEVTVAQEHLASEAIRGRLVQLLADARGDVRGVAVLACPTGERHDLGLLMLAILLRADGWQVAYLGADTPLGDALDLAGRVDARLLCLSLARADPAERLREALRGSVLPHGLDVIVGGSAATPAVADGLPATRLNGDLTRSVRAIRAFAR